MSLTSLPFLLGCHSYSRVCAVIESVMGSHGHSRPWFAYDSTSLVFLELGGLGGGQHVNVVDCVIWCDFALNVMSHCILLP